MNSGKLSTKRPARRGNDENCSGNSRIQDPTFELSNFYGPGLPSPQSPGRFLLFPQKASGCFGALYSKRVGHFLLRRRISSPPCGSPETWSWICSFIRYASCRIVFDDAVVAAGAAGVRSANVGQARHAGPSICGLLLVAAIVDKEQRRSEES